MTITVNIGDADLSELLAKVEAGEEIILSRGETPIARISPIVEPLDRKGLVETIMRERIGRQPITQAEIAEWKQIGRM